MMNQDYRNLNLSKLKSCNQYWSEMASTEGGRICAKCSNVIHDFRDKSPFEIAKAHAHKEGKVCGLYTNQQLGKNKPKLSDKKRIWWKTLLMGVTYFLSTDTAASSEIPYETPVEVYQKSDSRSAAYEKSTGHLNRQLSDTLAIKGKVKVIEEQDSLPVAGVTVMIKGSNVGSTTDFDGNYLLTLPDTYKSTDTVKLIFSYIGYAKTEVPVKLNERKNVDVTLSPSFDNIIEFYVTYKPPLHRRIWNWLSSPFRK